MVVVSRAGFEPAKIPKNRLIYHKPHLSLTCAIPLVSIKYVFVVLGTTVNPKTAIKTILFEQKIMPKDGLISLYAPYNKLLTS